MTGMLTASLLRRLRFACIAGALLAVGCGVDLPPAGPSSLPPHGVPAKIDATATPGIGANGGTATIVARVLDGYAVAVADVAVTFSADSGVLSVTTGKTDASGAVTSILVAPAGGVHVKATTGALQSSDLLVAVQPRTGTGTPTATPLPTPSPTPTPEPGTLTVHLEVTPAPATLSTVFAAQVSNLSGGIRSVTWTFGDGTGFIGVSTTAAHTYNDAKTYRATVTLQDEGGRSASDGVDVPVSAAPPPTTPVPGYTVSITPVTTTVNGTTTLKATVTQLNGAPAPTSFDWDCTNDSTIDTNTSANSTTFCKYSSEGTFTASVVAKGGTITATGTGTVTVNPAPLIVTVAASPNSGVHVGNTVTFTATVTSAETLPATLEWEWDDDNNGTFDTVPAALATPTQARPIVMTVSGTWKMSVRVTDPATGRTATGPGQVTVLP
jgi:PKD domain-containing protein